MKFLCIGVEEGRIGFRRCENAELLSNFDNLVLVIPYIGFECCDARVCEPIDGANSAKRCDLAGEEIDHAKPTTAGLIAPRDHGTKDSQNCACMH